MTEFPTYNQREVIKPMPTNGPERRVVYELTVRATDIPDAVSSCASCPANLNNAPQPDGLDGLDDRNARAFIQCNGVDSDTGRAKIVVFRDGPPKKIRIDTHCKLPIKG